MTTPEWWRVKLNGFTGSQEDIQPDIATPGTSDLLPLYGLILFTFILLLAPQQIFPVLAPLRIAMLSIVLVSIAHINDRLGAALPILIFPKGVIIAWLLAGWAVATVPLSSWPGGSVAFFTGQYLKSLIVFLLIVNVINSKPKMLRISWALVLMALPLALTAINNLRLGVTMGGGQRIIGYQAPLSENPNDMALLLNLLLPLAIGLFLGTQKKIIKWLLAAVILTMITAIIATFSRAGFLTLAVSFCCYLFLLRNRPEKLLAPAMLVMALLLLPFMPGDYIGRISTITDIQSDQTGSAQIRTRDTLVALTIVSADPLIGAGIGMNTLAMSEVRGDTGTEIHNVYLALAVELGLPGLIIYLSLLIAAIRAAQDSGRRLQQNTRHYDLFCIAEGLKVSLIAFSVAALFHPVAYHFYFYYIAGLALAMNQLTRSDLPCSGGQLELKHT